MILTLSDFKISDILTPWGKEISINYFGRVFMPMNVYRDIDAAILACRNDLDAGHHAIVVTEANRFSVWWHLPEVSPQ
jgi:hypothetical protein